MPMTTDLMDNPRFKALIDGFAEVIKTSGEKGLNEARQKCTEFFLNADPYRAEVASIEDAVVQGTDDHPISLRIYKPAHQKPLPVLLYLHRGGWIFGNNRESEPVCRLLAHYLECIVVAVEYRLAPEHSFPKPLEDCYAALEWTAEHCSACGGDPNQLIACGESAGGNLAAAVCMLAKMRQGPNIAKQFLIYPMITAKIQDAAYDQCADRYFITKEGIQFMWNAYLQNPENMTHPLASLDCATELNGLPPAVIVTGEFDPLREEAERFGEALSGAGVLVKKMCMPEAIHGFLDLPLYPAEQRIAWLKEIGSLLSA